PMSEHSLSRRHLLGAALTAAGGTTLAHGPWGLPTAVAAQQQPAPQPPKYKMRKSINLWAFPYPQQWSLEKCLRLAKDAGFDGIELNYDLESELSPKSGTKEFQAIRRLA